MLDLFKYSLPIFILSLMLTIILSIGQSSSEHDVTPKCTAPLFISVYRTESCTLTTVPMETYVACVVACEVPGTFHEEALKAQAVATRTYATAKLKASKTTGGPSAHPMAPVCDSSHCQVYNDISKLKEKNGWARVKTATKTTEGQLLYFNDELLMYALFHSSSGGKTENSEDVFVSAVPYLKSVDSPYEGDLTRNGHGVGMSQHGANGMARAGYTYEEILSHYYNGAAVY